MPSGISDEGRERVRRAKDNPKARTNRKTTLWGGFFIGIVRKG